MLAAASFPNLRSSVCVRVSTLILLAVLAPRAFGVELRSTLEGVVAGIDAGRFVGWVFRRGAGGYRRAFASRPRAAGPKPLEHRPQPAQSRVHVAYPSL
jgi:hypothetical protein